VFICSSDDRLDILDRVLPSVLKYWPDCPYPLYVGLNTENKTWPRVSSLVAQPSEWRIEVMKQVSQIPETHLILLLDDYLLLSAVDQLRLAKLVTRAVSSKLPYLRLLPLRRSLGQLLIRSRIRPTDGIESIHSRRPFYSGLQIAIWDKQHLLSLLESPGSIWDFEHQQPGVPHYVITEDAPISYRHLVEKGRWLPYAESLLRVTGLSPDLGSRPSWPSWMNMRLWMDEARFLLLGYANH
jgi:hypothetical protein